MWSSRSEIKHLNIVVSENWSIRARQSRSKTAEFSMNSVGVFLRSVRNCRRHFVSHRNISCTTCLQQENRYRILYCLFYMYTYCLELLSYFAQKVEMNMLRPWPSFSVLDWIGVGIGFLVAGRCLFFVFVGASLEKSKRDIKVITITVI